MFEKYDAYKDSGIQWIGQIPEHWEIEKAKWIFLNADRPIRPNDGIVTCFRDGEVTLRSNRRTDGFTNALKEHGYQGIRKGDLVIHAMDAFAGAIGVSDSDGKSTPVYSACIPRIKNRINVHYYAYYLRNLALAGFIESLAKGIRERTTDFRFADFAELLLPFPKLEDQERIVAFLNQKTAEINQAIAIKEQQIALLNERKQIVIQKAVTQGLEPNVPMKDSGVEWIGQIPEHWEVKKIKYATKIFRGKFTHRPRNDPSLYDGKYPFFQTGDVAKAGKFLVDFKQTLNEKGLRVSTLIPKGTVVITIAANIGDVSILGIDACFPDSIVGFQPKELLDRDFLFYSLLSMKNQFVNSSIKNTQMNLNVDRIGSNYICVCPKDEQINIVEKIEEFNANFENAINLLNREIGKLKEYKATLINDAVTGKIKVA